MQGMILAAGMGKRLGELTSTITKCMIEVNGITLIERMLKQLDSLSPALSRIVIVIGYEGEKLKTFIEDVLREKLSITTPLEYIQNKDYATTNNIVSLYLAKDKLQEEDTLLLESDLIFEDSVLEALINDERPSLALVDKYESWMDGTVVKIDDEDTILTFIPGKKFVFEDIPDYYKTVNMYKFSRHFSQFHYVPFLIAYSTAYGKSEYYEQVLRVLALHDDAEVKAKRLTGQRWYEIDDIQDLDIAASMFNETSNENLNKIHQRYGGYWRYPKVLDFCYLVNPYYPPLRLLDEIKANIGRLISAYPSGARVNSLLAAKNFSIREDYVLVGNGAAELIASMVRCIDKPVGIVRPTFEEYPNRIATDDLVTFTPQTSDFSYNASDLMNYFENTGIKTLVLVNPDNPSGNYLSSREVNALLAWCKERSITLVLDESFSDFADEPENSFLTNAILADSSNLVVIKSISKSYGVPGVRLGILATSNKRIHDCVLNDVSIWNINSIAEFYMQIAEKYKEDYLYGLELFRAERDRFFSRLSSLDGIKVFPSQANYFMVELVNGLSASEVAAGLFESSQILVKDLTDKVESDRQYVRLAIRDKTDNDALVSALNDLVTNR